MPCTSNGPASIPLVDRTHKSGIFYLINTVFDPRQRKGIRHRNACTWSLAWKERLSVRRSKRHFICSCALLKHAFANWQTSQNFRTEIINICQDILRGVRIFQISCQNSQKDKGTSWPKTSSVGPKPVLSFIEIYRGRKELVTWVLANGSPSYTHWPAVAG